MTGVVARAECAIRAAFGAEGGRRPMLIDGRDVEPEQGKKKLRLEVKREKE